MNPIITKTVAKYALLPMLVILGSWFYKKYHTIKQDNDIEEVAELVIKEATQEDIDLSPESKEPNGY